MDSGGVSHPARHRSRVVSAMWSGSGRGHPDTRGGPDVAVRPARLASSVAHTTAQDSTRFPSCYSATRKAPPLVCRGGFSLSVAVAMRRL